MSRPSRTLAAGLVATVFAATPLCGQRIELSAGGVAVTNSEVDSIRQARGLGVSGGARLDRGPWRFEVRGLTASLESDFTVQPDYAVHQLGAAVSFLWGPGLRAVAGVQRRWVSPEFAAQEVGLLRLGIVSETRLSRLAQVEARADYFPLTRFTGGGDGGFSLGFGLGARVGSATGRLYGMIEYAYERLDREVNGAPTPIRFSVARVGVGTRL
jgi:hypothetical protein